MNLPARALALALLLSPLTLFADGLGLEQIAKLHRVTAAAISPDGERIAYLREVPRKLPDQDDGPAWVELHVLGPGGESRPFVTGEVNVSHVDWTADGRHITFLIKRADDDTRRLYGVPYDGGEARELARLKTDIHSYSLSPDGRRAALLAFEPEPEDLKRERELGFTQVIFEEDWQPRRVYIVDLENPAAEASLLELEGSAQEVKWSPAGDRLALKSTPRELVDDTLIFPQIRMISPQGEVIGEVETAGKLGEMAWSPDGERLALIGTRDIHDTREGRLMVVGAGGGEPARLLPDLQGHVWNVDWTDNRTVLFVSHEGVNTRLGTIRHDGSRETTLIGEGPVWTALSVSGGGRVAMIGSAPEHPPEVFRLDRRGSAGRLTDSNPWLADVELARQEVVTYEARDGLEIEGILFWPLDYTEGERYPLILAVHGGPEAHYSNGWLTTYNLPAQHAAAEGYFMFYPNYRGSTGRGVEFALTSQGRPAAEEFDDLVDGVDYLIERGLVDGNRVGITGGSYGGYASAWGATYYSERFAASVMNVGLSDKIAMLGTSDIPQELYLVHYLTWPWEDWEMYRKASPIYYASQARTPILILHGDADPRVDPTQSKIMYRYLELQDDPPPVRLVLYRGEGHSNQRAATRRDYSMRLMRWMDHYLKGEGGDPPDYRLDYGLGE